jgi:hypothetical protein
MGGSLVQEGPSKVSTVDDSARWRSVLEEVALS